MTCPHPGCHKSRYISVATGEVREACRDHLNVSAAPAAERTTPTGLEAEASQASLIKERTMTDPFSQPVATSGGSDAKIADFVGRLLLLTPTEYLAEVTTVNGVKDAVRTACVVLDGGQGVPTAAQEHADMLVFQGRLIGKLKGKVNNGKVLGRLVRLPATPGQQAPYDLLEYTPEDAAVARRYLEAQPVAAPF